MDAFGVQVGDDSFCIWKSKNVMHANYPILIVEVIDAFFKMRCGDSLILPSAIFFCPSIDEAVFPSFETDIAECTGHLRRKYSSISMMWWHM